MKNAMKQQDNVVYVHGSEKAKQYNDEQAERVRRSRKMIFLLAVLAVVIVFIVVRSMLNRKYEGYRVVESNETYYENAANYVQFAGGLLKYTPDGASYINTNGDVVWSAGIDMMMPMAVTCGDYAVLADVSGNSVYVFNTGGQVSSLTMPYKICDVDVANQGAFAVVLESDKTNYTNLYDKKGNLVYERQTTIDKSGYPLDISISDDGQKMFTSYINIDGTSIKNNLAAYNFGDVGQNSNADRIVGGYVCENEVVPKVEFVDNNTVVAFGTNTISIFAMREKPSEKARLLFDTEIRSIFYSSDYIGVIQNHEEPSKHLYKVTVYDLDGNKKFSDDIDFYYDNVYADDKELIISGNSDCRIYRANGSVKFDGTLSGKIVSVVPNGKRLEYVVVYDNATEIIKLKSEKNSGNEPMDLGTTATERQPAATQMNEPPTGEPTAEPGMDTTEAGAP